MPNTRRSRKTPAPLRTSRALQRALLLAGEWAEVPAAEEDTRREAERLREGFEMTQPSTY